MVILKKLRFRAILTQLEALLTLKSLFSLFFNITCVESVDKMHNIDLEAVKSQLEPVVESHNIELYDIEFIVEHGRKVLRLYIEQDGGISLDECELISRAVEASLDANDPIPSAYVLEVSSPGIERKLVKDSHYQLNIGKPVAVKLKKPFGENNQKNFRGVLVALEETAVVISTESEALLHLPRENMIHCRLIYIE